MLEFARAGAAVGSTTATLEKTRILGAYFRTLDEDDLRRAAVYMSGRAFAPSQRRTLGLGWSTLSKVISSISGRDDEELGTLFRKHSDLGDWAGEALDARTAPQPVSMQDVEETVEAPDEAFTRMGAGTVWTEEKYDGVRCQLHRQGSRVELFSRDLKETTAAFPELVEAAPGIGHDVLFDGEVLAHREGRVLRFFELQRRLGRKQVDAVLRRE